jgi:hypothetical protein
MLLSFLVCGRMHNPAPHSVFIASVYNCFKKARVFTVSFLSTGMQKKIVPCKKQCEDLPPHQSVRLFWRHVRRNQYSTTPAHGPRQVARKGKRPESDTHQAARGRKKSQRRLPDGRNGARRSHRSREHRRAARSPHGTIRQV